VSAVPRRHARAPLLLAALALVLGAVIYVESLDAARAPPAPTARAPEPASDAAAAADGRFAMPPLRSFAEVLARPLFSSTRRPMTGAAPAGDAPGSGLVLVGIVIAPGDQHALIEHGQPPRLERVVEGQEVEGWTVEAILPDAVGLRRADQRLELKAKDAPPGAVPPPPPRRQP